MSDNNGQLMGNLQRWKVEHVVPYPENAKQHPPEQIKKLAAQIKRDGWDQPIVVDKAGVIIKGHGRRLAAIELGLEYVPVLVRTDMTEKQVRAARLGDNQIPLLGGFDFAALSRDIHNLLAIQDDLDISIDDLGFNAQDFVIQTEIDPIDTGFSSTPTHNIDPSATTFDQSMPPQNPLAPPEKDYSKPDLSREQTYRELRQIIVDCADEAAQEAVYNLVTQAGYVCRPLTI